MYQQSNTIEIPQQPPAVFKYPAKYYVVVQWPHRIVFDKRAHVRTGKLGVDAKHPDMPAAEYKDEVNGDDSPRVWLRADGEMQKE